ncbi:hypothetical protein PACTADRAFT_44903 [Pachysolen tannophilus NRRL Y-2460]|uniref:Mannosyltransferase n=1 Tax=Pachysolen tannophilus NRRL Y-2460 TaxID=669874 RepID=A0A1E4TRJ4_PACTA|nr:hypothetical protein PACTADRAFT_44903 [Pachysolen tannophilus NRRL Y-2460]
MSRDEIINWNMREYDEYLTQKIDEPKVDNLVKPPADPSNYDRANATLLVLARNRELNKVIVTIQQIEDKFNNKYHYPYTFLNDAEFSQKFINGIKALLPGRELYFEAIDPKIWKKPSTIDKEKEREGIAYLKEEKIGYSEMESYHNMCRFYSGNFYKHPRLAKFKWYWRFEPGTNYFCKIDYDLFKFMEMNNKTYGFTISLYDAQQSIKTLWPTTLEFLSQNPQYLHPNGAFNWLTEDFMNKKKTTETGGYSTCHFWSNFEIGNMDFFRSEPYDNWFQYLDSKGGFYYERWGDAPVHSVGLGLFEDKSKIHWFRDIGYEHYPYYNCPNSDKCNTREPGPKSGKLGGPVCEVGKFSFPHLYDQNCVSNWVRYEMTDKELGLY